MSIKRLSLFLAAALALLAAHPALAQKLQLKVVTGSPEGFSVNSTLVYGAKDAILIDAQFTQNDARRVVKAIQESGKNLTVVYITHGHPDHYFGADVIRQAFPKAKVVALPQVIEVIRATAGPKVKQWKPVYGDNITGNPVIPEPLQGNALTLEGETLEVVGGAHGDDVTSSYVWIPSLKAAVVGDIAFDGIYPWTADTSPATRKLWAGSIAQIAALNPAVVVAGHKKPELKDDPASLNATRDYLAFFDQTAASAKSADELMRRVKGKYPDLGLDIILKIGSQAAFAAHK